MRTGHEGVFRRTRPRTLARSGAPSDHTHVLGPRRTCPGPDARPGIENHCLLEAIGAGDRSDVVSHPAAVSRARPKHAANIAAAEIGRRLRNRVRTRTMVRSAGI